MNYEYSFDAVYVIDVLQHLASYKMIVYTMTLVDNSYVVAINTDVFPEGEYQHLQDNFNFQQVIA